MSFYGVGRLWSLALCASALLLGGCAGERQAAQTVSEQPPLKVALAPYQDLALLVNEKNLGLEQKYGTKLELVTLAWEDIPSAIASAGTTADVGFMSITDYLSQVQKLNSAGSDPIVVVYPIYLFRGGGFVSFNPAVPVITQQNMTDRKVVEKFFSFKVGAQRNSIDQMAAYVLAKKAGMNPKEIKLIETTLNDGFLAAVNGSLDTTAVGLTQRTEALKQHGRMVLNIDTLGIGDLDLFVCKASTYKNRKKDIDNLVRMWFDCTNYVLSDIDHHSNETLSYLKKNAATKYTLAEFKKAIGDEYIPTSLDEAKKELVDDTGRYPIKQQSEQVIDYLVDSGRLPSRPAVPVPVFAPN